MTPVAIPEQIMMNEDIKKTLSSLWFTLISGPTHENCGLRGPRRRYTRSVYTTGAYA